MKYLIIIFLFTFYACKENPDRVEEMSANNGKNYVKKYFKNNSKSKMEVYDKNTNKLLIVTEFDKETITKIVEFYPNLKKKLIATLLKKPNFFGVKNYSENGKKESEGSLLYNYKKSSLSPVSYWLFYNKQTGEIDSIGHYFSDGDTSVLVDVERIDNKNKKMTKIKYFEAKPKDTLSDSITWEVKRIR
ncbi:hypothetical protein Q73A0000_03850 [Kaistella flava (ex Peng et al. 2021)]|uniref:Lipoprotein n=1 Tax=Kaistella flava (ex Peng et al. 2021) TaxID=2038776 RepID=A0A7M2Y5N8_9FLAO|nr:hypothetical protein [Kaistella flava (ex Peng et al. 2021)]QOW09557.1 hypothetical protein Q73A0000_03850 [Kaistella flava (ex Peng et al. 2021)]